MASNAGKTRNPWGVWLLSIVTLGIYGLWWYWKVNDEVRRYDPRIEVDPTVALLALLFGWIIIVPPFVSIYRTGQRISMAQEASQATERASGWIGLLLAFLWSFYLPYYQTQINKVWDRYGNPTEGQSLDAA
jgi:hypothetical protein